MCSTVADVIPGFVPARREPRISGSRLEIGLLALAEDGSAPDLPL
jgi:hypothetical protein